MSIFSLGDLHCRTTPHSAASSRAYRARQSLARLWCALFFTLTGTTATAATLPDWALQPVRSQAQQFIFAGTGDSYPAAQLNALASLMTQLSSQVHTEQQLTLNKQAERSQHSFTEHSRLHTLDLDINGLHVLQHYEGAHEYAVQLSVSRPSLERALRDRLSQQTTQQLPTQQPHKEQVLWALQNKTPIAQAQRYERALASLGYDTFAERQQLQQQSALALRTLQQAGIRITHPHDLQFLAAALRTQFPSSTQEQFLLKLEQRTFDARSTNNNKLHRIILHLSLIDAQQPFRPYLNQEVTAIGTGKTAALAAQDAQQKLLEHVNQDLSVWFFN